MVISYGSLLCVMTLWLEKGVLMLGGCQYNVTGEDFMVCNIGF